MKTVSMRKVVSLIKSLFINNLSSSIHFLLERQILCVNSSRNLGGKTVISKSNVGLSAMERIAS